METNPLQLPHSEEAERAVLAACYLDYAKFLPMVAGKLAVEDFWFERHQLVFQSMVNLQDAGEPIDLVTLKAELERDGNLETVGGLSYLASLDLDLPDLSRVDSYVEIVRDRSTRRRLLEALQQGYESAIDPSAHQTAAEAVSAVSQLFLAVSQQHTTSGWSVLGEMVFDAIEHLENSEERTGMPTGLRDLDRMLKIAPGHLVVIAGRPGMGKTSLAVNIGHHVALHEEKSVGMFSLEMSKLELALRVLAAEADVPGEDLREKRIGRETMERLIEAARRLHAAQFHVDENSSTTMAQLNARARQLHQESSLDLLIVDYLQLMNAGGRHENRNLEIASISRSLKQLAKDLQIPVIALSQLNRKSENRGSNHRPQMSDLKDSGAIEQDADAVVFVYRDEYYNPDEPDNKGLAELIVAKNRHGSVGTVETAFLADITTFRSLERYAEPSGPMPEHF